MTSSEATFGDAAGEMSDETEVEAPLQQGASASAGASEGPAEGAAAGAAAGHHTTTADEPGPEDTSGVSDMVEEGGPIEPADVLDVETGPSLEEQLEERTSDLQRLTAEYANYRKRVERDRQLIVENATYKALTPIIDVLDTIDRAKEHGELDEGFRAVADQLARAAESSGLVRFGEPGDAFDPNLHEALSNMGPDPEVEVTTCKHVAKGGYKIGDRVVRAAQVLVVEPVEG